MKSLLAFLLIVLVSLPAQALAGDKIRGKYDVIGSLDTLKGVKQVEMLEFFNYSCGHCYTFLEAVKKLHKKYKDKLFHKKFPIYWGQQTPYPSMAYYISDELGIEEKFTQELFDTNFKLHINIFQPRIIKRLSMHYEVEKEMAAGMQSQAIKDKVEKSLALAKKYNANETPTVILNKVLKIAPSHTEGDVDKMVENIDLIIEDILSYN
ncbi:MAG: thioredoxin domain-containing protein [Nitrospinae bacterium]|nr:thioredoxin domain-containing protein [Nitrospinota bacterium]